jgi:histidinol-phosphatase (PHP family)
MPVDYHIHTKMCGHAQGEMEEYVEFAIKNGLKEIGFSDHIPMYFFPVEERDLSIAMKEEDLPQYISRVREVQGKYSNFPVKLGIEADFAPGLERELKTILDQYKFDYVLGSIHYLDGWGFDNPEYIDQYKKWDIIELYRQYFATLALAAESGLFDSLAHPDLIKKFGFKPSSGLGEVYDEAVKRIAATGVCIEINTAGLRLPCGEMYPTLEFLKLCRSSKIPVTLGSDAHKPEQVGSGFGEAIAVLRAVGYNEIITFTGRLKKSLRI